jgi:UDP-GlcNAc:undecaprenyl-phosphate GlcNAc-1-phosphate transferase
MAASVIVVAVAAVVAFLTTPFVRTWARRMGIVDVPSDRKVHRDVMPYGGGIALLAGILAALGVASQLDAFDQLFTGSRELIGIGAAATVIAIVGLSDDRKAMQPTTKLAGQLLAAGILVAAGVEVVYFWFPGLGVVSLSSDLSAMITILWALIVMNAVNLVDGLDGLAAGIVTIAASSLFVYSFAITPGEVTPTELLMMIVVGACVGFLPFNSHPASIFMGDAGSMVLGLLLASGTVLGFSRTDEPRFIDVAGFIVPVLLPVLILAIPLVDAALAIVRRLRGGRSVMHADKEHLHHRLYELFESHRTAVAVIELWSVLIAAASISLAVIPGAAGRRTAVAFGTLLVVSVFGAWRRSRRIRRRTPAALPGDVEPEGEHALG